MSTQAPVPRDPNIPRLLAPRVRGALLACWMLASGLCALWAATQLTAHKVHYHTDLGQPLWVAQDASYKVYAPWSWLGWQLTLSERMPRALEQGMGGLMLGVLLVGAGVMVLKDKTPKSSGAHGSARWAMDKELHGFGLMSGKGVVLGKTIGGELICHDGPEHVMVFAPTRSGKGVGLVLPTLLQWAGSTVVLDFKGENFDLTAGYRSRFGHTLRFEPTSDKSVRFNPLDEVRLRSDQEIRDVQNIAQILCDPGSAGGDSAHWVESAADILSGVLLHVLYAEQDKSLAGVGSFLKDPERPLEKTLEKMLTTLHLKDRVHPFIAEAARSMLNRAEKERSGIVSTVVRCLRLWTDPLIAKATRSSDFHLSDLMTGAHPTSLYLVVPPSDVDRLRPLLRMMITQLVRGQLEALNKRDHRLLMLLDEFPALGKLGFLQEAMAYVAGYGIKMFIVAQDLKQMEEVYGRANTILSNCNVRVAFAPSDDETAKRLSQMLGQATWSKRQESESGKKGIFGLDNRSRSLVEYGRDLLTPNEMMQLDPGWELVMVTGKPPIITPKVRHYSDPRFVSRLLPPPTTWRDTPAGCAQCLKRIREVQSEQASLQLSADELAKLAQQARLVVEQTAAPHAAPPSATPSQAPSSPVKPLEQVMAPEASAPVKPAPASPVEQDNYDPDFGCEDQDLAPMGTMSPEAMQGVEQAMVSSLHASGAQASPTGQEQTGEQSVRREAMVGEDLDLDLDQDLDLFGEQSFGQGFERDEERGQEPKKTKWGD
jgi:type IV secretion system protein VirD4